MRPTLISLVLTVSLAISTQTQIQAQAQEQQNADSTTVKLAEYIKAVYNFSRYIPQEVAYVQMDNTCYYQGDDIFFKCYVTGSNLRPLNYPSRTLYVELLNPGGEVIERRTLKIENGACHGAFSLKRIPFYSGFYEVRAYTKYMLNFGGEAIFSRRIPVFDKPKTEGDFAERTMRKYGTGDYPSEREKPEKGKRVNLKFYAEGGNLVSGMASRVAFEMTDAWGNAIDATAQIMDADKQAVVCFAPTHQGRGVFEYTPATAVAAKKERVLVEYEGKKFWFDPPTALDAGFVMRVDNISSPDSVKIAVGKSRDTLPSLVGVAIISRGTPRQFSLVHVVDRRTVNFCVSKSKLPAGVSQVVMFAPDGRILADRLIFTPVADDERLAISWHADKARYAPFEAVDLLLAVKDHRGNPIRGTMSVAVRDAQNHLQGERNIMTDMLLVSEIKGYVSNPAYYFEADDSTHRAAADLLMMVQGWRRYPTAKMAGVEPFELRYAPEEGIEVLGEVVSFVRGKPKAGVDVSAVMLEKGNEDGEGKPLFFDTFTTDSLGRFAFVTDIEGTRSLILSVAEKGKRKDHRIVLDRVFAPAPRRYEYAELQLPAPELHGTAADTTLISWPTEAQNTEKSDYEAFVAAYRDSLSRAGIEERVYQIKAVKIEAKKRARERDIFTARSKSVAYYDVTSEIDEASDRGRVIADDIHELLINMNSNFRRRSTPSGEYILYKWKMPLIVINYERTLLTPLDRDKYKFIRVAAIKSIYVNETLSVMSLYSDPRLSPMDVDDLYSCAVFIETYPDGEIPAETGKGVRRTRLEGYSEVREFYAPDYSTMPPGTDYRRTLYWNPSLTTDSEGTAAVRLFHNSRGGEVVVDAQTITAQGVIGITTEVAPTP